MVHEEHRVSYGWLSWVAYLNTRGFAVLILPLLSNTSGNKIQHGTYATLSKEVKAGLREMKILDQYKEICGKIADQNNWPWVAGLYKVGIGRIETEPKLISDGYPSCVATLISSKYLLTAASCVSEFIYQLPVEVMESEWVRVFNFTTFQYLVRFGNSAARGRIDPLVADNMVEEIMFHPFEMNEPFHNIAILKLVKPMEFNSTFVPACLPSGGSELPEGTACQAIEWNFDKSASTSFTAKIFSTIPQNNCEYINGFRENFNLCVNGTFENECMQLSNLGGGLFYKYPPESQRWSVFGVAAELSSPDGVYVYSAVPSYSRWIDTLSGEN